MENKSHALIAGAFVLIVSLMLVTLAWWLMRDTGRYARWEMSTRDSVTGLQPQAPVRFKGVAVGKVTHIGFDPQIPGNVLIRISVDENAPLTPTTFATLAYQGVTGLAYVLLDDTGVMKDEAHNLQMGPKKIPRLPLLTSGLGRLTAQAPELMAQISEVASRANDVLSTDNQAQLSRILQQTAELTQRLNHLSITVEKTLESKLNPALSEVPQLVAQTSITLKTLQTTSQNASLLIDEIRKTTQRVNQDNGPLDRLAQGSEALAHAAQTFGSSTLPRVNQVSDNTSRAVRQFGRTVSYINDNPQSLIFGTGAIPPGPGEPGFAAPASAPFSTAAP